MTASEARRTPRVRLVPGLLLLVGGALLAAAPARAGNLFVTHPASDFLVVGGTPDEQTLAFGDGLRGCTTSYCEYRIGARVPHGSRILGIELNACSDPGDGAFFLRLVQRPVSVGSSPTHQQITSGMYPDGFGCHFLQIPLDQPLDVDHFENEYLLVVAMGSPSCLLEPRPSCQIVRAMFQAVRVYYTAPTGGTVEPTRESATTVFPP